ncbi:hypothetical protein D5085_02060 [Ectothiorhodospiraceae bacterium BW-2]|nr:hypothetical protein D5085_02060 [Ectothiorhodospiraceae bacterium BW-2]
MRQPLSSQQLTQALLTRLWLQPEVVQTELTTDPVVKRHYRQLIATWNAAQRQTLQRIEQLKRLDFDLIRKPTAIERQFCYQNGIDLNLFLGERIDNYRLVRTDESSIIANRGFKPGSILPQIDALLIHGEARFANSLIKLNYAYNLALTHGIKKIYHSGFSAIRPACTVNGITIEQLRVAPAALQANLLVSVFFYNQTLKPLTTPNLSRYDILQQLRPCLAYELPEQPLHPHNTLTIHLRAGDIFSDNTPHFGYGQPPLAFYIAVLQQRRWHAVQLVYEDEGNPVVAALKTELDNRKLPYSIASGTLADDIAILAAAEHLVIGRGTFTYPLICLSKVVKTVYYFQIDKTAVWGLERSDIKFVLIQDINGNYQQTILANWRNTPEQRQQMLTYPQHYLRIAR